MTRTARLLAVVALALGTVGVQVVPAHAAFPQLILVNDCSRETGTGGGDVAIGDAVFTANNDNANDGIVFSCSGTIPISYSLNITGSMTINASSHTITLDGGDYGSELFSVSSGRTLKLNNLTLSNGTGEYNGTLDASYGGAIDNSGTVNVTNSSFLDNTATSGGAIDNLDMTITNSTIYGNSAPSGQGGGIWDGSGSELTIGGSIVAANSGGNCADEGGFVDDGYNLENTSPSTCAFGLSTSTDIVGQDPLLGSLASNGGPTQTMALSPTSPVVDRIPTSYDVPGTSTPLCPSTDQRGVTRPHRGESSCDIGAYELQTTAALQQSSRLVGSTNTLTASNFRAGETVSAYWDQVGGSLLGSTIASSSGTASIAFTVPQTTYGSHQVVAVGGTSGDQAAATLTVLPHLAISPTSGKPGSSATVSGTGYGAAESVTIRWNCSTSSCTSTPSWTVSAGSSGDFSTGITIPTTATVGVTYSLGAKGGTTSAFATTTYYVSG